MGDRREALRLQALQARLARAAAENRALKAAVHSEVDAQRQSKKEEALRAKLRRLEAGEAALDSPLCYGLPPGWSSGAPTAAPAPAVGSGSAGVGGFEWPQEWQAGTEVVYSVAPAAAAGEGGSGGTSSSASGQRLCVKQSERPVRLQVAERPFAIGGLRQAFYARDEAGGRFVLKRALLESPRLRKAVAELHWDAEAAALAGQAADAFCRAHAMRGTMLHYITASVVVLEGPGGGKAAWLKEPWVETGGQSGRWVKWTRNDGHVFPEGIEDATVQAFTHFSLHFLRERLGWEGCVLDAQGVVCCLPGGQKRYQLTDPALCTADKRYGRSDLGRDAVAAFLRAHTCGLACSWAGCKGVGLI